MLNIDSLSNGRVWVVVIGLHAPGRSAYNNNWKCRAAAAAAAASTAAAAAKTAAVKNNDDHRR